MIFIIRHVPLTPEIMQYMEFLQNSRFKKVKRFQELTFVNLANTEQNDPDIENLLHCFRYYYFGKSYRSY